MRKRISLLLMILMMISAFCGSCGSVTDKSTSYKASLSIMSIRRPVSDDDVYVNAPNDVYDEMLSRWQQDHPDIKLSEQKVTLSDLSSYACMQHLPDVFMLDSRTGRTYANYGLILDLTNYINDPDYKDLYNTRELVPFTYYGRYAAFPVLTKSYAAVIYDRSLWKEYGYDAFPDTWDGLASANDKFTEAGYEGLIALGGEDGFAAVRNILSPSIDASGGLPWFQKMIDGDEDSMFYDSEFTEPLDAARDVMAMGLFGDEQFSMSATEAAGRFIKKKYPAVLTYGDDIYRVIGKIREEDPERYGDLGFAALPAFPGQSDGASYMAGGTEYGLYINAETALDPEKLELCLDLCRYLTGPEYANEMAGKWGRTCFAKADESLKTDYRDNCSDELLLRLSDYLDTGMQSCPNLTQYLNTSVLKECGNAFSGADKSSDGYKTTEMIVLGMQCSYERYYLKEEDYSKARAEGKDREDQE